MCQPLHGMLAHLVAPMLIEEFLADFWTKKFACIPGPPQKLAHFFPWGVLNRAIEQHRFSAQRLVLVKEALKIDPARYLDGDRIDATGLMEELEKGATLIFNSCEEVYAPLGELCASLERLFHTNVYANLYAGWRRDNSFEVHWDDQDNLILQVAGRKHWKVWDPIRCCPFKRDIVDTSLKTRPEGPPAWDGVVEQGWILNVPRGWWHVAYPMDEPCLHVTVTVESLNGIGLLHWFVNQMKVSQTARMALPIVASQEERHAWRDAVWRDLCACWEPDIMDRYVAQVDRHAKSRPLLRLPDVSSFCSAAPRRSTPLQLALPRPMAFETSGTSTRFLAGDIKWDIAPDLLPALERFNDGRPHTIAELSPDGNVRLNILLGALVMKGVLRRVDE
jgi:hypothetical protein